MTALKMVLSLACVTLAASALGESLGNGKDGGKTIAITISPGGPKAKFTPFSIRVSPGDTVVWKNTDGDDHTATSTLRDAGKALFDTGDIEAKGSPKKIHFDDKLFSKVFKKAGGQAGGKIVVDYHCLYHKGTMKAKITLVDKK